MIDTVPADEMVELRPARSVLVRHHDADMEARAVDRSGPVVTLRSGAVWIRAEEDGPGVTVTHGASSVQVRDGAAVVEVADVEALLVVVSGRAAVRGVSPLPRTVSAGQASTLTLDGVFSEPAPIDANELAADRMIVENLTRDALGAALPRIEPDDDVPVRVDAPPPPTFDEAGPTGDGPVPDDETEADRAGGVADDGEGDLMPGARPVGRGDEGRPVSDLETALRGVGVVDDDPAPSEIPGEEIGAGVTVDAARRTRVLLVALIVAFLVAAVVAAVLVAEQAGAAGAALSRG